MRPVRERKEQRVEESRWIDRHGEMRRVWENIVNANDRQLVNMRELNAFDMRKTHRAYSNGLPGTTSTSPLFITIAFKSQAAKGGWIAYVSALGCVTVSWASMPNPVFDMANLEVDACQFGMLEPGEVEFPHEAGSC